MLNLHVVQARYGDCLILEYGLAGASRYMLIDGGPSNVYGDNLRPVLQGIREKGGGLDFVVLSHVDDDHIVGLVDLLSELQYQRENGLPETIPIGQLWHNTFSDTIGRGVETRFNTLMARSGTVRSAMPSADRTNRDIAKGDTLTRAAGDLDLPINESFDPSYVVSLEQTRDPIVVENLSLRIVGPNKTNLAALRQEWLDWLDEQEDRILVRDMGQSERAAMRADTRVPNLSSIMFLAEAGGKTILLTGDGRSDHLLEGLRQAQLLDASGRLHVDVLKLPHHGSRHNTSEAFLQAVTASKYVISASGRYGHPSGQTLEWIVAAPRDQGPIVEIYVTKRTESVEQLLQRYDPATYGYSLIEMPAGDHAMVLELAAQEP